ncbi:MAG: hypothetical protein JRM80_07340 [Nitrososphaerota archaeon]|nr:hypothetical protein [Nitrososphaerota archaeon]
MILSLGRRWVAPIVVLVVAIVGFSAVGAAAGSSTGGPILTNSLVEVSVSQATNYGFHGVSITYNNTQSQSLGVVVYDVVQNSAGNTVAIMGTTSTIPAGQNSTFFFAPSSLPSGSYTERIFATDSGGIPLSTTTTVQVTL